MKIIIAPDSYKGCLSSLEVAKNIEKGINKASKKHECIIIPMADGGEGTTDALVHATKGYFEKCAVKDPLMRDITAKYGILGDKETAVIEMAQAAGLPLLKENEKNPLAATTYGVGMLLSAVLDKYSNTIKSIIVGLGGSATNDGGMGFAQSLGVRFYNAKNDLLGQGAFYLSEIAHIDCTHIDKRLHKINIIIASDVTNPLTGKNGATFVYSRQKGADTDMMEELEVSMQHYAEMLRSVTGKDIDSIPGSGAAGGLGAALLAFANAVVEPGIEIVKKYTDLDKHLKNADLLITGEGKTDRQTLNGKVSFGLAKIAKKHNVPVISISGSLEQGYEELYHHVDGIFSIINYPMNLHEIISKTPELLQETSYSLLHFMDNYLAKRK